jgi:hypothetical protein
MVPVRQLRQKYFSYFFILIAGGLLTDISRQYFHDYTNSIYVISALLRVVFLQDKNFLKTKKIFILILIIIVCDIEFIGLYYKQEFFLICIFHFLLFFKFIQTFIIQLVKGKVINLFLLCLFFYELTLITKFFVLIVDWKTGNIYLVLTTIFEMLFAIFFCIFKQDSRKILIKINTPV